MQATILTIAALAATVTASIGTGSVINSCDYEVNLNNVPASGNGQEAYQTVLSANGGTYSQEWTSLLIGGWSMKLNPSFNESSVMQFEYTYSDLAPDDLWFDLSYVNGNPFSGQWLLSSSSADCIVKQTAYLYPTDDSNGMQRECTPDVSITVTLCPADDDAGTVISSVASSVASPSTYSTSSTESTTSATSTLELVQEATSSLPTSTTSVAPTTTSTPSSTTFATKTTSLSTDDNGSVVTEVDTVVATQVVTVYGHGPHFRRHNHAHHRN